jgi:hypothetical protein
MFDDGASLAGKESIDSVVILSDESRSRQWRNVMRTWWRFETPATAPVTRLVPLAIRHAPRQDRRLAPYTTTAAPASETS